MDNKPASMRIIEDIRQQIENGIYSKDSLLPSENELSMKYKVNRVTVQKALSALAADNYIYSVPGKGTFAKEISLNKYKFQYEELTGFDVKLISVDIILPPPEVIYYLHVPPNKHVVNIKRIALKHDIPIAFDIKYIPYYTGIQMIEAELNYSFLSDYVSTLVSPYEINGEIEISGTEADIQTSSLLNINAGTPVVELKQRLIHDDGTCVGWGKIFFTIDHFKLAAEKFKK